MSKDMLKESIKNKDQLIPADFDSRINSLLASLPDELPASDGMEAEVIKRPSRINIRPLVSAAAVFAIAAAGMFAFRSGIQNTFNNDHDNGKSYVTTSFSETAVTTAETSAEITELTDADVSDTGAELMLPETDADSTDKAAEITAGQVTAADNGAKQTGAVTAVVTVPQEVPTVTEAPEITPAEPSLPAAPSAPAEPSEKPGQNMRPGQGVIPEVTRQEHPEHPEHPEVPGHSDRDDKKNDSDEDEDDYYEYWGYSYGNYYGSYYGDYHEKCYDSKKFSVPETPEIQETDDEGNTIDSEQ